MSHFRSEKWGHRRFEYDIQSQIDGQMHSFNLIDRTTDPKKVVNYPTEFQNSLAAKQFTAQGWLGDNHATQSETPEIV